MSRKYAVLPCNGLDKPAGCLSREIALMLSNEIGSEIICPVFYRVAGFRYDKLTREYPLLALDGCATRCASKLAAEKGLKIAGRVNITDLGKREGVTFGKNLTLTTGHMDFARGIVAKLLSSTGAAGSAATESSSNSLAVDSTPDNAASDTASDSAATEKIPDGFFPESLNYESYQKGKFIFRLPKDEGFYYIENDVWAYVAGNRARIGLTDYAQKSLSDIVYFTPPALGERISQFDAAGSIESVKAVFEVISPVSGVITAFNEKLTDTPELVNENPYEQGWIAEIELNDFPEDRELLYTFHEYMPILKRKVDEYRVKN